MNPHHSSGPWYRHRWPWLILALLAGSVSLTASMVWMALQAPDTLVTDNYYEAGKGISRSLQREQAAQALQVRAQLQIDDMTGEVDLRLSGASSPAEVQLALISPTQARQDRHLTLRRDEQQPGRYVGHLDAAVHGRRLVELVGEEQGQTWRLFEEESLGTDRPVSLGDEPVQGRGQ